MFEWEVSYSETRKEGTRISCGMYRATVYAKDEDEVKEIMADDCPGMVIHSMTKCERVEEV